MTMMGRVTRENKCPICDGDTWCLIGQSVIICMRTVSPRPKNFKGGEVGYIHPHPDPTKRRTFDPRPKKKAPQVNVQRVLNDWRRAYPDHRIGQLATVLGVTYQSLTALDCHRAGYSSLTWGFPMFDGYGNRIGIRLRNIEGNKWAVTGSQAGIFVPNHPPEKRMFVVEGPTNTAAALSIGLYAIGRPSCSGGVSHIRDFVKRHQVIKQVVIIGDNDQDKMDPKRPGEWKVNPGVSGAKGLQEWLPVPSCILLLPTNDIREFIKFGDKSTIDSMIEQLVWTQPKEVK
jgi:hypothetical protein